MKKYIALCCMMIACLLNLPLQELYAEEGNPFEITASAGGDCLGQMQEIMVSVSVKEEVALDAFTFCVTYNQDVCKLYTGNDEWMQGYGFEPGFQSSYQDSGMLVSNAQAGKVFFSGASSADTKKYQGIVAKVELLFYGEGSLDLSEIGLEITALHVNGAGVDLPADEGFALSCPVEEPVTGQQVEEVQQDRVDISKNISTDAAQEEEQGKDEVSFSGSEDMDCEEERTLEQNSVSAKGGQKTPERNDASSTSVNATGGAVLTDKSLSISKESYEKENKQSQMQKQCIWLPFAGGFIFVVIVITIIILKKKKECSK